MLTDERDNWPLPFSELDPALALMLALEEASMGVMLLHQEKSESLFPVLGRGLSAAHVDRIGVQRVGVGPFGTAATDRRPVSISDAWQTELSPIAHELGFRAIEIIPLCRNDGPAFGVAAVMFPGVGGASSHNPSVTLCTGMVVCLLENARLRQNADTARARAEQIARDKVEFLARLSHELRNPLNALGGYLELLQLDLATGLTGAQSVLLERVRRSEAMLVSTIEDLITFAKLEVGHIKYQIDAVPVTGIIEAADLIIRPVAESRRIALHVDVGRRLAVRADASRVRQVLTNLLTNAVKFTPEGGTIRLTCRAEGPDTVEFIVSDTGIGIPADKLDAVFRPYVQAGPAIFDGLGGSGLGLAISQEFAQAMGGRLTVRSVEGSGSTFTLRLPRARDAHPRSSARPPMRRGARSGAQP